MREILFRGKRVDNGEWIEGFYCPCCFGWFPCRPAIVPKEDMDNGHWHAEKVDPETVGQFTGLYDSTKWEQLTEYERDEFVRKGGMPSEWKGKKIFEGDIVRITDDFGNTDFCDGGIGSIEFCNGFWYVGGQVHNGLYDLSNCYYVEVIGNIHDNPELLKGGDCSE